jgi:phosphoglycerol transferase MdoB-like AlkP superfamily enzyme/glycerophosphoryl diester phosphodiesterase
MQKKIAVWVMVCIAIGLLAPIHAFSASADAQEWEGYALRFSEVSLPDGMYVNLQKEVKVRVENTGTTPIDRSKVYLSYHWRNEESEIVQWDGFRTELPDNLAPGENVVTTIYVYTPSAPGSYVLELDAVMEDAGWFSLEGKINPVLERVDVLSTVSAISQKRIPRLMKQNQRYTAEVAITNVSPITIGGEKKGLNLSYHWKDKDGQVVIWDGIRTPISNEIPPGETVVLEAGLITPPNPGRYTLEWDLVHEGIAWLGLVEPSNVHSTERRIYSALARSVLEWSWMVVVVIVVAFLRMFFGKWAFRHPAFQRINHAMDAAGANLLFHSDVFLFVLILYLKFVYFAQVTGFRIEKNGLFLTLCFLLFAGGVIGFVRPAKWRILLFGVIDVLLSILILADLVYWRYFGDVLSANVLLQTNQAGDITASIMELISKKDAVFLIFGPLVWAAVYGFAKKAGTVKVRFRLLIPIALVAVAVGFSVGTIADLRKDSESHGVFSRFFLNQMVVEKLGLTGFHIYDTYVYLNEGTGKMELSDEQLNRILQSFKWNTLFENRNSPEFGIAKGKNLIVIQMESLQEFAVGLTVGGQEVTPNLNRLKNEGFYFNRYFDQTNQGRTSDGEFTSLVSLYPLPAGSVYFKHPFNNYETSLPNVLKNHGYTTMSAHAYRGDFWNRANVHPQLGFEISKFQSDMPNGEVVGWYLGDHVFFSAMVDEMKKLEQPFFSLLVTLSNHHPYDLIPPKYKTLSLGDLEGTLLGNYLHSIHYSDMALGVMMDRLKEQGLYDNTVVVIYGDHDAGLNNKELLDFLGMDYNDYQMQMIDKVPFLIHIPGMEGKESSAIGGHLDMTPTLLHLFGIEVEKSFYYGNNLFANNDEKIVVLPNGSFVTKNYLYRTFGSFESGKCYVLESGTQIDLGACRQDYETAVMELEFSQQILKGDLLGTLQVEDQKIKVDLPEENWWKHGLIAHAMGGTEDGHTYTNSLEAFEENYAKGHRLFEVDLVLTRENILVARHDWLASTAAALEQESWNGDEPWPYEMFINTKINRKYTPLSFSDIVNLMIEYPDIYIITDTKSVDSGEIRRQFQAIVEAANEDAALLDRIIPQYYSPEMYYVVSEIYPFKNGLYTLYMTYDSDQQIIDFMNQNSIEVVTIPTYRISQSFMENLLDHDKVVFVHTINDQRLAQDLLDVGVYGLYTDFLVPDESQ